jgi:hypothetical protein
LPAKGAAAIVPVASLPAASEAGGAASVGGIGIEAVLSDGAAALNDCRPIGVGEVIEGIAGAGMAGFSAAGG